MNNSDNISFKFPPNMSSHGIQVTDENDLLYVL